MKEKKYNLFYDYSNSSNVENIKENYIHSKTESFLSNFYYYPKYNNNSHNIKLGLNSTSLNKIIKERKEAFNKICSSINNILHRYKNNKNNYEDEISNKENKEININHRNKNSNVNRIVEHLIRTFSKEELKLIKEKINTKVEEDEEPKPEILLPKYNTHKKNSKLLITNNLIRKDYLKNINKNNTSNKPIKLKTENITNYIKIKNNTQNKKSSKKIIERNINSNLQLNPSFLTYAKCKTSLECLDNFLKRKKNKKTKSEKNKINKGSKTPNLSMNTSAKYLIRSIKKLNKDNNDKNEKKETTPVKYVNHKYDYIKSLYRNDKNLLARINEHRDKKIKEYERIKTEQNKEKLEQCTFKPDLSKSFHKNNNQKRKKFKPINDKYIQTEIDNKNSSYLEFYQYKKNKEKILNIKKERSNKKGESLSLNIIPKNLKKTKSDKKIKDSKFLEFHQLIIQKSLKELNES